MRVSQSKRVNTNLIIVVIVITAIVIPTAAEERSF